MTEDRATYVEWCKTRAREYLAMGDIASAVASMLSDMNKRDDTRVGLSLSMLGTMAAMNRNEADAKLFIEGF